jgi:hypothetical protein
MRKPLLTLALFAVALVFFLLAPLDLFRNGGLAITAVLDLAHAPAFAVFAVLGYWGARQFTSSVAAAAGLTWLAVVAIGILVELLQGYTGRGVALHDAVANLAGATAGILWATRRSWTSRRARMAAAGLGAMLIASCSIAPARTLVGFYHLWRQAPLLSSFESEMEVDLWSGHACRIARDQQFATDGDWSLRVQFEPDVYPGIGTFALLSDWHDYTLLTCDVTLEAGPPLDLILKIQDRWHNSEHDDRFHQTFELQPGTQTLRVRLSDVAQAPLLRQLDMTRIGYVQFFTLHLSRPRTIWLDNLRLH